MGAQSPVEESKRFLALALFQRVPSVLSRICNDWVLCGVIGVVALGLDLYRLGEPGLWFDEILSVERARQSISVIWQIVTGAQPNMALYYFLLHYWLHFTALFSLPDSEDIVRLPSVIFAVLSAIVVFWLGRRFFGRTGGFAAAGLYVLNDLQLVYAQETRSYALQLFLLCLSWYALFAALTGTSHQKKWWFCYVVTATLAVYAHLFSLLIFFAQVLAAGGLLFLPGPWQAKARARLRSLMMSMVMTGILIIPMLVASRVGGKTDWLPIPKPVDVYYLFLTISGNSKIFLGIIAVCVLFGLLAALIASRQNWSSPLSGVIRQDEHSKPSGLYRYVPLGFALLCWLIVPVVVSYVVSQKSEHLFSSRYLVTIVPPLFLLVGMSIAVLRWRLVKVVLTFCLLLLALHYVPLYYQSAQVEDWRTPTQWVVQHYQQNDGMVCYDNSQGCQVSTEYYLRLYKSPAHFSSDSPGAFRWVTYDITNRLGNYQAAVDIHALAAYAAKHPHLFFITARLSSEQSVEKAQVARHWLDSHYRLLGQFSNATVTIRLYLTNTSIITT